MTNNEKLERAKIKSAAMMAWLNQCIATVPPPSWLESMEVIVDVGDGLMMGIAITTIRKSSETNLDTIKTSGTLH